METIRITKADIDSNGNVLGDKAKIDVNGHVEIDADLGCVHFVSIKATGRIRASAGSGISAGLGISAGSGISAKRSIAAKLRIFAGVCMWRKPTDAETEIRCAKLESGEVAFGKLVIVPADQVAAVEVKPDARSRAIKACEALLEELRKGASA